MSAGTDTTKHENGVGAGPQGPETGFLPRIGVRGRLSAGMTMALRRPHIGDENGLVPGTGNHKGICSN